MSPAHCLPHIYLLAIAPLPITPHHHGDPTLSNLLIHHPSVIPEGFWRLHLGICTCWRQSRQALHVLVLEDVPTTGRSSWTSSSSLVEDFYPLKTLFPTGLRLFGTPLLGRDLEDCGPTWSWLFGRCCIGDGFWFWILVAQGIKLVLVLLSVVYWSSCSPTCYVFLKIKLCLCPSSWRWNFLFTCYPLLTSIPPLAISILPLKFVGSRSADSEGEFPCWGRWIYLAYPLVKMQFAFLEIKTPVLLWRCLPSDQQEDHLPVCMDTWIK